ncbi:hypothetical protein BDV59DRAFT_207821 [Aspergillus ambiguus]|uniref:uncharacterized protein n=1 Tax=Aspergillus ambiguus TaxID=176160 RepID=UPI003CCCC718
MGGGHPSLPQPLIEDNQMTAAYTYPSVSSDETESDITVTWSPGDGICPSTAQFDYCYQSKFDDWRRASLTNLENSSTFYLNAFLNLKKVPPFFQFPPEGANITGKSGYFLILKYSMQIRTTHDPNCDHPHKMIDYMQCLGSPAPAAYQLKTETQIQAALPPSTKNFRSGYFTNVVLAWSYIVSCRWVEIFQQAGWKSQLLHENNMQIKDAFWDIVTQSCWVALARKRKADFYSPWMLTSRGTIKDRDNLVPVTPNSSLAFDILLEFCISEGLEGELLIGLISVLFLTSRNAPAPKFAPPTTISTTPNIPPPRQRITSSLELFKSIDKCMFLSSTQDALDSLACSAFFDPSVPCNLIGAASLGIRKALSTSDGIDKQQLLKAVAYKKPYLAPFWAAIIRNDQVTSFLNFSLNNLPPICLVVAFWTATTQSFLQIAYSLASPEKAVVSRVNEFQTSYYCRQDTSVPWSPAPPFGTTPVENLSLEVRAHLQHIQYWILDSGERVSATKQHQVRQFNVQRIDPPCSVEYSNYLPYAEQQAADEQSGAATSRLFNWHRSYDDGIWLDDGTGDIEFIRQLQNHPWIDDPFFKSQGDDPVEERKHCEISADSILQWDDDVEKFRQ